MPPPVHLTVVDTEAYLSRARKRLTGLEQAEVILMIASDPRCGDLMIGTGGVRKIRYGTESNPAYLFTVFAKNEKDTLSDAEKKELHSIVSEIKRAHRRTK